jgi:hypothetical protein
MMFWPRRKERTMVGSMPVEPPKTSFRLSASRTVPGLLTASALAASEPGGKATRHGWRSTG